MGVTSCAVPAAFDGGACGAAAACGPFEGCPNGERDITVGGAAVAATDKPVNVSRRAFSRMGAQSGASAPQRLCI